MRRIWHRLDVIVRVTADITVTGHPGQPITGHPATDVDLCYLELRKCLVLMILASVIALDGFGHELSNNLRDREYHAGSI